MTKACDGYNNPKIIQLSWFNLIEGDDSRNAWKWCSGKSSLEHDKFQISMEISEEIFDKNIKTDPTVLKFWAETYNITEDEVSKFKLAMGYIIGSYGTESNCDLKNPSIGTK